MPLPPATGQTVGALGEFGLIDAVTRDLPRTAGVLLGPGDDAAVVAAPDGRVVITTDLLVEGVHFRRDWSSAADVGVKAAAQNLADVAAMGAVPTSVVLGLATPPDLPVAWARELTKALVAECASAGASLVGGDVVRADGITLAVTATGDLEGRAPVLRSGAQPGDVLAVCGRLGWSAAGLAVLRRGFRSPRVLVEAHRRPAPPYAAGPAAARAGATAMCDVSDGLLQDLGHLAHASGVTVVVDAGAVEVPDAMSDAARALGADPLRWILSGGEDHALVATFPPDAALPAGWLLLGSVEAPGPDGPAVLVPGVDDVPSTGGHDHFRAG